MESNEVRDALRAADRAEAMPWVDYPPTPRWWTALFGLWAGAFTANIAFVDGPAQTLGTLASVLLMVGLVRWDRRRRGTYPSGRAPRELRRPVPVLFGGALVIAGLAWLIGSTISGWLAAAVAAAATWCLLAWYERAYAAAARRVRERLA